MLDTGESKRKVDPADGVASNRDVFSHAVTTESTEDNPSSKKASMLTDMVTRVMSAGGLFGSSNCSVPPNDADIALGDELEGVRGIPPTGIEPAFGTGVRANVVLKDDDENSIVVCSVLDALRSWFVSKAPMTVSNSAPEPLLMLSSAGSCVSTTDSLGNGSVAVARTAKVEDTKFGEDGTGGRGGGGRHGDGGGGDGTGGGGDGAGGGGEGGGIDDEKGSGATGDGTLGDAAKGVGGVVGDGEHCEGGGMDVGRGLEGEPDPGARSGEGCDTG
mmetsp:Transcript_44625/g.102355  ORF Transcript_44625/g.102355 Transcript_44625/m.102355 type:complete len:274 (+) Transcript_44625:4309-5130(+)